MPFGHVMGRAGWLVAATLLMTAVIVLPGERVRATEPVAQTWFQYNSSSSTEPVGRGGSERLVQGAGARFDIFRADAEKVSVAVTNEATGRSFVVTLQPGRGDRMRPGVFLKAERPESPSGRAPGMNVRGFVDCNAIFGSFKIHQVEFDAAGKVTVLEATFRQHCDRATAPVLTGTLNLKALPFRYSYNSEAGDFVGQGRARTYRGAESIIVPTTHSWGEVTFFISGLRDNWHLQVAAPGRARLKPGTYKATNLGSSTEAKLSVHGNARACDASAGSNITVHSVRYLADGTLAGLHMDYVQQCSGSTSAMRGTMRYLA